MLYSAWVWAKFERMLVSGLKVTIIIGYMHCDSDRQLHHGCYHHSDPCSLAPNKTWWCKVSRMIWEGKPVKMGPPLEFLVRSWSTFYQHGRDLQGLTPGQGSNPTGCKANPGSLERFRQTLLATSQAGSGQIFCLPKTRQVWLTQGPEWVEPRPATTRQARLIRNA